MSVEKWRSPIFEKKNIWAKNGLIRAKKGPKWGFELFFIQKVLLLADYVYYDRKQQYIAANAGLTAEKLFAGP